MRGRAYPAAMSLRRVIRALRRERAAPEPAAARLDSWLEHYDGDRLRALDAACADGAPEQLALFRDLEVDVWALLLTQEYDVYPNIRALLPSMPEPWLQVGWNGTSGVPLAAQGAAFYRRLLDRYAEHGAVPLNAARVLDFGCGWGRLTRFLARDVAPGRLYGCDPVETILDVCRSSGVPATLARSDFLPDRLPFEETFDLAFAFSVFTHLSERAHERCLDALHGALALGGLLVVTVRPPAYMQRPADDSRYVFVPHAADPSHPQWAGGEMEYGEAVIPLPYVRERWADRFELLAVDLLIGDLHQVMLTLRRR
jgi:SAM-dependent methyltransferase